MVGADVIEDPSLADYVGRLMQLRKLLAHTLSPNSYETTRDLRWHGAMPGEGIPRPRAWIGIAVAHLYFPVPAF